MAFFTRKGLTVPEFPNDGILTEESEEFHLPPTPSSLATEENSTTNLQSNDAHSTSTLLMVPVSKMLAYQEASSSSSISGSQCTITDETDEHDLNSAATTTTTTTAASSTDELSRYDYVVDRTYGVEV